MGIPQPSIEAKLLEGLVGMAAVAVVVAAAVHLEWLTTSLWKPKYLPYSTYLNYIEYSKENVLTTYLIICENLNTYLTLYLPKLPRVS